MAFTELDSPLGILPDGKVPPTRVQDAKASQARIHRLVEADGVSRSKQRALVKGLVDGNPPYKASALKNAGRSDACNVNWRIAESYLNNAIGAFYDVFSESSTYATVELEEADPFRQTEWSGVVTEEFHRLQREDRSWDSTMQNSQYEMVLFGIGPQTFQDEYDWRTKIVQARNLLIPDRATTDVSCWEEAAVICDYAPHQLYQYIRNEGAAPRAGWNIKATRDAIMHAHPQYKDGGVYRHWEWHQDQLKTKSFSYSAESSVIRVAHYYVREFPDNNNPEGAITHAIVMSPDTQGESSDSVQEYLYFRERRYNAWERIIHPMYYDNLGGGLHHAVTGMGVKMYAAMAYQNRLLCNLADKAFAPKIFFKPTSAAADQALNIVRFADYGKVPPGYEIMPHPINAMIEEGLVLNREISNLVSANLSSYRQDLETKDGNPRTATEVQQRASEQARLGKTQLTRYYNQLDWLYAEKYRRAANARNELFPGGKAAKAFQDRCVKRGVPLSALKKVRSVQATRVVGQGSEFMRQTSLEFLLGMVAMLPESGRANLVSDVIAARAGQFAVQRYFPRQAQDYKRQDQLAFAMVQIGSMKDGVPAIVTDTQDHILFAQVFINAATESFNAVAKGGGNPAEVLRFVELAGRAIAEHLQALQPDETRKAEVKEIEKQLKKLGAMADQLREQIGEGQQEQAEAAQGQQQVMGEEGLKTFQAMEEEKRRNLKLQQDQVRKDAKLNAQLEQSRIMTAERIRSQRATERNGENNE